MDRTPYQPPPLYLTTSRGVTSIIHTPSNRPYRHTMIHLFLISTPSLGGSVPHAWPGLFREPHPLTRRGSHLGQPAVPKGLRFSTAGLGQRCSSECMAVYGWGRVGEVGLEGYEIRKKKAWVCRRLGDVGWMNDRELIVRGKNGVEPKSILLKVYVCFFV